MYVVADRRPSSESPRQEIMSTTIAITYVLFGKLLGPARVVVAQARDSDRARPIAVVKGSATATKPSCPQHPVETSVQLAEARNILPAHALSPQRANEGRLEGF